MDGTKTRTSGGKTLSSDRTAPLKPKPGLSGPPARHLGQLHIGGGWPIFAFLQGWGFQPRTPGGVCYVRCTHPWCAPSEHRRECGSLICLRSRHFRSEGWPARLKPGRPRSVKSKRAGVPAPHDQSQNETGSATGRPSNLTESPDSVENRWLAGKTYIPGYRVPANNKTH
jgi:hypothetical protein